MRKPSARAILIAAVAVFGLIQLWPVDRTNPPVESPLTAAPEVETVLRRACYDCHSNETQWPLYAKVAPVSWWLAGHVREGRAELNFSVWTGDAQQLKRLAKTPKELAKGAMPPWTYRLAHRGARLTADEIATLGRFATATAQPAAPPTK